MTQYNLTIGLNDKNTKTLLLKLAHNIHGDADLFYKNIITEIEI